MKDAAIIGLAVVAAWTAPARAADAPAPEPSVNVETPAGAATLPQGPPPLLGPPPAATQPPPSEASLATSQILLGSLTTLGVGGGSAILFGALGAIPLDFIGLAAAPAIGARVVCSLGRNSPYYDGGCGASVLGGYLGAIVIGAGLGLVFYTETGPGYDGEDNKPIMFAIGAALGTFIGTGIGATIGWHLGKHRRGTGTTAALTAPPLAPPAALADWPELRARTPAHAPGTVIGVPLLALRF
ncbi:MAG TPA: hypothetical protein VGP64_00920 [Polyangia bacterium]